MNPYIDMVDSVFGSDEDKLFVFGGDGTFLRALRKFGLESVPMVYAFKCGRINFMLPLNIDQIPELIDQIKQGSMHSIKRHRLLVSPHNILISNELVIRSAQFQLNEFMISINEQHTFYIRACEIVISTRSGSTGYNCSLSGPLVFTDSIIINCSAPNRCNFRTLVLPLESQIKISAPGCAGYFDGILESGEIFQISVGDSYRVAVSDTYSEYECISHIFYSFPDASTKLGQQS